MFGLKFNQDKFKYMFKHKHNMGFKTITIKESVYKDLLKVKKRGESFSELFERLAKPKKTDLTRFYGAWKMSNKEAERITKAIRDYRKSFDKSFEIRMKRMKTRMRSRK